MQGQVHSLNSVLLFCKCSSSSITWIFSLMNPLFYSDAFCNRKVYNTLWWSKKCLKRVSNSIMKSSYPIFKYPSFETSRVQKWFKAVIDNNIDKEFRDIHIEYILQTILMKLIFLCVWAEPAVLVSAKTALKYKYEI